jgi:hypothetical protein
LVENIVKMWKLLLVLAFSGAVVFGIRCPFESPKGNDPEEGIFMNISIGTPGNLHLNEEQVNVTF